VAEEAPADAARPSRPGDDDRLDVGLVPAHEQRREADDALAQDGDPEAGQLGVAQVLVEPGPRVVAADTRVPVDLPMPLHELAVQGAARLQVRGLVGADRDVHRLEP
jgi:hypothetical protein